jgi:hypothetical protein
METNAEDQDLTPKDVDETPETVVADTPVVVTEAAPKVLKAPVVQTIRSSLFNAPFAPPGM